MGSTYLVVMVTTVGVSLEVCVLGWGVVLSVENTEGESQSPEKDIAPVVESFGMIGVDADESEGPEAERGVATLALSPALEPDTPGTDSLAVTFPGDCPASDEGTRILKPPTSG